MAKINIVINPLNPNKFSGGLLCIMEYAAGLARRNHEVTLIPILPSKAPKWFKDDKVRVITSNYLKRGSDIFTAVLETFYSFLQGKKNTIKLNFTNVFTKLSLFEHRILSYELKRGASINYFRKTIPAADITIATSYETALPVFLYGAGKLFYFIQHYEPFFKNESSDPFLAEKDAKLSYHLGLNIISNSTWLRSKILIELPQNNIHLCPNAIDQNIFCGIPKVAVETDSIKVISYGGRDAVWKGFKEMAEAIKIVRQTLPQKNIQWYVYGDALLPENNSIAPYISLGFLQSPLLAKAYQDADIFLSSSWYESFPLFPLEAMACGLPVVTSQIGTEEYAIHGKTAEIITARQPDSIAKGLLEVIINIPYRNTLAINGNIKSKEFNWDKSVNNFENILLS